MEKSTFADRLNAAFLGECLMNNVSKLAVAMLGVSAAGSTVLRPRYSQRSRTGRNNRYCTAPGGVATGCPCERIGILGTDY